VSASRLPPIVLIGHPHHLRTQSFLRAASTLGLEPPIVIAHTELIEAPERLRALAPAGRALVRIDAVGQSQDAAYALWRKGRADAEAHSCAMLSEAELAERAPSRFELRAPRQLHFGLERYLRELEASARPEWTFFTRPSEIALAFDKNASADRFAALGIPVPQRLGIAASVPTLCDAMVRANVGTAYVKLAYASSGSGLAIVRHDARRGRTTVWSTVAVRGDGFYNSRRILRYDDAAAIDTLVSFLLREGARVEASVPKARVEGRYVDLRVLVIAGAPAFVVVRASRHPITNLQLGARAGDTDAFVARVPPASWSAAMADCLRAADALDALHLGLDVVLDPTLERHTVLEANAFGDFLPRARRDGLDPHAWQLRALCRQASALA
jgi:hypothetical protein